MTKHTAQREPLKIKNSLVCALLASGSATAIVYLIPQLEIQLFARGAATLAGLLSGAPVFPDASGWIMPILSQRALINGACSGTDFYLLTATLIAWHLPGYFKRPHLSIPLALLGGLIFTISVNALRILCVAHAHYWIIPNVPENYANFIHMSLGAAVFLPALILLNIAFEYHDRKRSC